MSEQGEAAGDLLEVAWGLVAENGWRELSLAEVARRSGRPLAEVYDTFPSRQHLLVRLGRRVDRAMLEIPPTELAELTPRERLFELIMRRFDALQPFRPGLRRIAREAGFDPGLFLIAGCNMDRMARWLLDAASIRLAEPIAGAARHALALLYGRVFNVWLRDDTADRSKTLAELDKRLGQLERLAGFAQRFGKRRRRDDEAPGDEPAAASA
jgi:AcrR family transcriptional regulator